MDSVLPLISDLRSISGAAQRDEDNTFYDRVRDNLSILMREAAHQGKNTLTFTGKAKNTSLVSLMLMRLKENLESAGYSVIIDIDLHGPNVPLDYLFTVGW
jgi:hypothetical protein